MKGASIAASFFSDHGLVGSLVLFESLIFSFSFSDSEEEEEEESEEEESEEEDEDECFFFDFFDFFLFFLLFLDDWFWIARVRAAICCLSWLISFVWF